jgi:transcriptional regulator with XRE-family HTH domain
MRAAELGEFLRSRRERLRPGDVGLPDADRRRAPGLRREEVATLSGVTVSWVTKLEQGHAHAVSADVLDALARTLHLGDTERAHLFALAGLRAERHSRTTAIAPMLRALLDGLDPNPAYLLDRAWNIVAFNEAEAALFPQLVELADAPPNLLELVFCDDTLRRLMVDHDQEAARLVAQLRVHRAEWPDDNGLSVVIAHLQQSSEQFSRLWAANDVAEFNSTRRTFNHPTAGLLEFDHHRLAVLDQPGMELVTYTEIPGTGSTRRLTAARQ